MTKRDVHEYNRKNYTFFLDEIKQEINKARIMAARTVNKELITLYWNIGKMIINQQEKHGWGKSIVERLSVDLTSSYGSSKGYSTQNLWYMRQLYYEYKGNRKLQQLVGEIPWGHNILILS